MGGGMRHRLVHPLQRELGHVETDPRSALLSIPGPLSARAPEDDAPHGTTVAASAADPALRETGRRAVGAIIRPG